MWFLMCIALLCMGFGQAKAMSSIPDRPTEPLITSSTRWTTHPVLGVVFLFTVDGIRVECAHAVFYQGPYPECRDLVGEVDRCMPISYERNTLVLISKDAIPTIYGLSLEPSVCLIGHSKFYPVTEKSYGR